MTILIIGLWVLFGLFFAVGYDSENNDKTKSALIKAIICLFLIFIALLFDIAEDYLLVPHLKDENALFGKQNATLTKQRDSLQKLIKPCPDTHYIFMPPPMR